jgi:hypothetical protein
MTSLVLEPANAGGTPDPDPGLVAVDVAPKWVKRARNVEADEPDLIGAK